MNYEVVEMEEKHVIGLTARANNFSPDLQTAVNNLWGEFYRGRYLNKIQHRKNEKVYGIYSDYQSDETGDYNATVACETDVTTDQPAEMILKILPAGKYAKFIVKGNVHQVIGEFWRELWEMKLERNFECDYEEYQNEDTENAEIHIYIGIK